MGWFLPSHMDQGFIFGVLGTWHLAHTLSYFVKTPRDFRYRTWIPVALPGNLRYLELWTLLLIVSIFITKQLLSASSDFGVGMIQMQHMQRYQHVTFAFFFLIYTLAALLSESIRVLPLPDGALQATFALGFTMELLVFHLGHHPGDNVESFVHMLMQLILVGLVAFMLLEMAFPRSFLISVARCMFLIFKGTWFFHIGMLLYWDICIPHGCTRGQHDFPVCDTEDAKMRARSLQVLIFGWHAAGIVVSTYVAYAILVHRHVFPVCKTHYHRLKYTELSDEELTDSPEFDALDKELDTSPVITIDPRSLSRRLSSKKSTPRPKAEAET